MLITLQITQLLIKLKLNLLRKFNGGQLVQTKIHNNYNINPD